ncbi:MAG: hypothetical protein AB7G87_07750 [Clostridia bacterium]
MTKGKYGLNVAAVAILAFIMGFFGFVESLILVVAFSVIAEKDDWLTRQTLQALFLRLAYGIAIILLGWVFTGFQGILRTFKAYDAIKAMADIQIFLNGVLYVALFVFALLAMLKLIKGQDAKVPFICGLVDRTMGAVAAKFIPTPRPVQTPIPAPVPAPTPVYAAPSEPVASPGEWVCSCGRENTGKFCMICGNPRSN